MSTMSCGSSRTMSSMHRALGIPKTCLYCGTSVVMKLSKSEANPNRRYFRCSYAAANKLGDDLHLFKWFEDALLNEVETLSKAVVELRNEVKTMTGYMEDQEKNAKEKYEEVIGETHWRFKITMIGVGVVSALLGVGIAKFVG